MSKSLGLDRDEVVALVKRVGARCAALHLGCSRQSVYYHMRREDYPRRRRPEKAAPDGFLESCQEEESTSALARRWGVSRYRLRRWAEEVGGRLPIAAPGAGRSLVPAPSGFIESCQEEESTAALARRWGVSSYMIRRWASEVGCLLPVGVSGSKPGARMLHVPDLDEFRKSCQEEGSISALVRRWGVSRYIIRRWADDVGCRLPTGRPGGPRRLDPRSEPAEPSESEKALWPQTCAALKAARVATSKDTP